MANNTFEVNRIQRRLIENGITRVTDHAVMSVGAGGVRVKDVYAGVERDLDCDAVLPSNDEVPFRREVTQLA